ncbi:MAG: S-layer homology domain-containing protein [Firmicutes bacterium]|nr:S-layer homology domain-containing protein [Bacillota bacterium]
MKKKLLSLFIALFLLAGIATAGILATDAFSASLPSANSVWNGSTITVNQDNLLPGAGGVEDLLSAGERSESIVRTAGVMRTTDSPTKAGSQVRVIVENATYPVSEGAPWDGTLVDTWVAIDNSSTMMSCVVAALDSVGATQEGAEDGYISEVNGLQAFDGGAESGWMGLLNDWLVNEGFPEFTVASGKLQADDVIHIMYSRNGYGADLGGTWENQNKTLKSLAFDAGALSPAFASNTTNYTLTVPAGTSQVTVTPTAANKNYQVRIKSGNGQYLNPGARTVTVEDGTVITVTCGDPSWPSMNGPDGDPVSYTVTVAAESAAGNTLPTLAEGVAASVNAKVAAAGSYTVDLSQIFTDADGDELTYKVSVNGADPVAAAENYSYTMDGSSATLVFTANDGQADSEDTYTVQLKKNGKPYIRTASNKTKTGTAEINREYSFTISMFTDPDRDTMTYQVSINGGEYQDAARAYKYTPTAEGTDTLVFRAYDGTEYSDDVCTLTLTVVSNLTPITVPSYATLLLEEKNFSGYNYKYFDPVQPVSTTVDQQAGTTTYYFNLPKTASMAYRIRVSGEGCVTYANLFTKTAGYSLTVSDADLKPEGKTPATVEHDASANKGYNMADVFLNINAQGYLRLADVGSSYQIVNLRNWEAVDSTTGNNFVEPDYHYTVIDENGRPSSNVVTVSDTGLINAVGQGTAIVLVNYDAMTYPAGNSVGGTFYGALWPENTGVFVVSVGAAASGINTGMTINEGKNTSTQKLSADALDAELDVIYFLGESGEYTFTPGTTGVSVSVAKPSITRGSSLAYSGFQAVAANDDGSYSVPLAKGRNIVKLEKDGKAEYQVISAKPVAVTVNNGAVVNPGDKLSIVFDTLYHPANKLAGVYNMNAIALYTDVDAVEDGQLVGGTANQYKFASTAAAQTIDRVVKQGSGGFTGVSFTKVADLAVPEDWTEDTFTLSGGAIMAFGFGDPYGNHRAITYTGGKDPNMSASTRIAYMGMLPDIVIPIGEQAANTAPTLAEGVEETAAKEIAKGETYTVNLDEIFTDAEEDDLTYKVSVNGADAVDASADYSYTPQSNGRVTLVFTANDGQLDSDKNYTVTLTVKDPVTVEITASVSKYGAFVNDKNGELLVQKPVTLSGKLSYTLNDAFAAIHDAYYPGGATAGYATSETQWGTSVTKFWNDTSGNIAYQIDHGDVYVMGPDTAVEDGNEVEAYILESNYPDSEAYVTFDKSQATVFAGETLELTLSKQEYDDNWMPVMTPYTDGADITVDGEANGAVTDRNGKVSLSFDEPGTYLVSAKDTKQVNGQTVTAITAPACTVTVKAVTTAEVDFTSQKSGEFLHAPQFGVEVASNLAESYGYTDSVDGVSVLDVLVKAHELVYEDDFTAASAEDYLKISAASGSPSKQFGVDPEASGKYLGGFFLNHAMANDGTMYDQSNYNATTVTTQAVTDGDLVEFFFYEDPYFGDSYNWFLDEDEKYSREFDAVAGQDLDLVMKSFFAMSSSIFKDEAEMVASSRPSEVDSAQVYIVDPKTGALTAIEGAEVEDGEVTLNFAEPGSYLITAYGTEDSMFMQLLTLTTVTVAEPENTAPTLAEGVAASATVTIPAGDSYSVDLSSIFTDADDDELTYKVSVNGADPVAADENYSFTPDGDGATLVFTANDGKEDSEDTYTVEIQISSSGGSDENHLPTLAQGVPASVTVTLPAGGRYNVNLNQIFTDADGDELTYKVSVNGADPVTANPYYTFLSNGNRATLVFTANDGQGDSEDTYTVQIRRESNSGNSGSHSGSGNNDSANKPDDAVAKVEALIQKIGDVTLDKEDAIQAARTAYDALSDAQQKQVKNFDDLRDAENKLAQLKEAAGKNRFRDVDANAYYADAVNWAVDKGVTEGTGPDTFSPGLVCSRAQVVTFLWRAAGSPEPNSSENPFTDVEKGSYYEKAVLWAVENGVTEGTGATTFGPDQGCSRAQVVTFLWRAAGSPEPNSSENPFTDVEKGSYYEKAVLWAVENGITEGTGATTFSPDQSCNRAQIVTFLYRAAQQ